MILININCNCVINNRSIFWLNVLTITYFVNGKCFLFNKWILDLFQFSLLLKHWLLLYANHNKRVLQTILKYTVYSDLLCMSASCEEQPTTRMPSHLGRYVSSKYTIWMQIATCKALSSPHMLYEQLILC